MVIMHIFSYILAFFKSFYCSRSQAKQSDPVSDDAGSPVESSDGKITTKAAPRIVVR